MRDHKQHIIEDHDPILMDVLRETRRAEKLFPWWPTNLAEGIQIVTEEAGEVAKAANKWRWDGGLLDKVQEELIQTAAMCVRQIGMIDVYLYDEDLPKGPGGGCPMSGG